MYPGSDITPLYIKRYPSNRQDDRRDGTDNHAAGDKSKTLGHRAGIETTCYALMALHDRQSSACNRGMIFYSLRRTRMEAGERSEVLLAIGRIEGKLHVYESLSQRVSSLERWQSWLKADGLRSSQCLPGCSRIVREVIGD